MQITNLIQAQTLLQFTLAEYSELRAQYWDAVYNEVHDYLTGTSRMTAYKSRMKRMMLETFTKAADIAWQDGGAELPLDQDANEWLTAQMNAEIGYIDSLFVTLRMLRTEESPTSIRDVADGQAFNRADGYAKTLDRIYSYIKVLAAGSTMLTFAGEDGEESCTDCQKYKGQRHRARWWIAHDAVPPNRNFECRGYRCQHILVTDDGKLFTI